MASACGSRLTGNQAALAQGAFGHSGNSSSGTGTGTGAQALGATSAARRACARRARRRPRPPSALDHRGDKAKSGAEVVDVEHDHDHDDAPRARRRARPAWPAARPAAAGPPGPTPARPAPARRGAPPRPPWPACRTGSGACGANGNQAPAGGNGGATATGRHGHDDHRRQHRQHQRRRAGPHPERAAGHRGLGRLREQHRRHLRPPDQGPALRRRQRLGHRTTPTRRRPARATSPWSGNASGFDDGSAQAVGSCSIPDMSAEVSTAAAGGTADIFGASPGNDHYWSLGPAQLPQVALPQRHPARGRDLPAGAGHASQAAHEIAANTSVGFKYTPANGIATTPTNANYGSIVQQLQSQGSAVRDRVLRRQLGRAPAPGDAAGELRAAGRRLVLRGVLAAVRPADLARVQRRPRRRCRRPRATTTPAATRACS